MTWAQHQQGKAMKLLNFSQPGRAGYSLGVKLDGGVLPVGDSIEALLRGEAALPEIDPARSGGLLDEGNLTLGPPVPNPGKILCVGLNYGRHAAESGMAIPKTPVLFSKFNNSVAAPGEVIPLPTIAEQYDYEVELAVVIGRRAQNVSEAEALDFVFGFTTANDLSARDLQMRTSQWLLGKTFDTFGPIGPCVATTQEIPDPSDLRVQMELNGQIVQDTRSDHACRLALAGICAS